MSLRAAQNSTLLHHKFSANLCLPYSLDLLRLPFICPSHFNTFLLFSPRPNPLSRYLLQGAPKRVAILLADPVSLQPGQDLQLLVGAQSQQVDDALPVWPLGHWVVGKALADGVGWVHGGRPFPFWDGVRGRGSWLSDLHLCTCVTERTE